MRWSRGFLVDRATSTRLSKIRQSGTEAELTVRSLVAGLGHRYTLGNRDLPGSPDLANRRRGWVVFVHGCYWHHHPGCARATVPRRNQQMWLAKFTANRLRDARAMRAVRRRGLRCLVVWECELRNPERVEGRLRRFLGQRAWKRLS